MRSGSATGSAHAADFVRVTTWRGEALGLIAGEALGIEVVGVVAAELAVRLVVAQHVVRDDRRLPA